MSKTYEDQVLEKLDEIIDLLTEIKENTTPVVSIPTIWTWPPCDDGGTSNYDPNNVPYEITVSPPQTDDGWPQPITVSSGCDCQRCNSSNNIKGCVMCGCMNIAVYTEDGNWWCNKCFRKHHDQDGNYRE